jgi:hypothetical protein
MLHSILVWIGLFLASIFGIYQSAIPVVQNQEPPAVGAPAHRAFVSPILANASPRPSIQDGPSVPETQTHYRALLPPNGSIQGFATDTEYVYSYGNIVPGADPKTFVLLNSVYEKDKYYAYFGREDISLIPGADPQSFVVFDSELATTSTDLESAALYGWMQDYAKNNNHVYYAGEVIPSADPSTFTLLPLYYAKDKNNTYFLGTIVAGADLESFSAVEGNASYFAIDKNHEYCGADVVSSQASQRCY